MSKIVFFREGFFALGAFSEMDSEGIAPYDLLVRKGIIKNLALDIDNKEFLDEKDEEKIEKIKKYLQVSSVRKIDSLQQARLAFANTGNYLVVFNNTENGGWNDFIGIKGEIGRIKKYEGKNDAYISTASYVSKAVKRDEQNKRLPRRTQTNILDIVQLTQDLDYYKIEGMTEDKALSIIATKIKDRIIELPHFVIFSGKGLQLVWLIDNVLARKGSGPERLFKAVQSYLMKSLEELNSDKVTLVPSNVIRLANTINTKNGEKVRAFVLRKDRLKLGTFKEDYLPIPKPNKKAKRPNKPMQPSETGIVVRDTRLWNLYSLNYERAEDIFRILEYKQKENENLIGIRQFLALVLRFQTLVYSNGDYELAESKIKEFWDRLEQRESTTYEEIEKRSRTAERYYKEWIGESEWLGKGKYSQPGLFYKNQTLIKEWDLSKACQVHLKTIKVRDAQYERVRNEISRRKKGVKSHVEKKRIKADMVSSVLKQNPSATLREVEELTGISKDTVSRLIKEFGLK